MDSKTQPRKPFDGLYIPSIYKVGEDEGLLLHLIQQMFRVTEEGAVVLLYEFRCEHPGLRYFTELCNFPYPPDSHNPSID